MGSLTAQDLIPAEELRVLSLWAAPVRSLLEAEFEPVDPPYSLEGEWELFVDVAGEVTPPIGFDFRPDHTLVSVGPPAEDGGAYFVGIGYWLSFPDGSFAFGINHPGLTDGQGASPGAIFALHRGRIEGDTLASRAVAVIDEGTARPYLGPIPVRTRGTRTTPAPQQRGPQCTT
jgi:hypothetical protein